MDFFNFFNLRLETSLLSNNISNNLIKSIIDDEQFQEYNYDYGVLFVLDVIFLPQNVSLKDKTVDEVAEWCHNFIIQLCNLSQYSYNETEQLVLEKFLFYKIIYENTDLNIVNGIVIKNEEYFNDILNIISLKLTNDNSIWLAQEKTRVYFFKIFRNFMANIQKNIDAVTQQLALSRQNQEKREQQQAILNGIVYLE